MRPLSSCCVCHVCMPPPTSQVGARSPTPSLFPSLQSEPFVVFHAHVRQQQKKKTTHTHTHRNKNKRELLQYPASKSTQHRPKPCLEGGVRDFWLPSRDRDISPDGCTSSPSSCGVKSRTVYASAFITPVFADADPFKKKKKKARTAVQTNDKDTTEAESARTTKECTTQLQLFSSVEAAHKNHALASQTPVPLHTSLLLMTSFTFSAPVE